MADWEDEDFGGFESADLNTVLPVAPKLDDNAELSKSKASSEATTGGQSGILSWILATSPTAANSGSPISLTSQTASKDENSATPLNHNRVNAGDTSVNNGDIPSKDDKNRAVETDASPFKTEGWTFQTTVRAEVAGVEETSSSQNPATSNIPTNLDDLFASYDPASSQRVESFEMGEPCEVLLKAAQKDPPFQPSAEFLESQNAIKAISSEELKIKKETDDRGIQELQAKLDAVVIMKEQTEKSLEKMQEELRELNEKTKNDLEEKTQKHEEDVDQLRMQHQEEMKELQKTSEETVKLISQQYSEVWKMFEKEQELDKENNANSIVEKCTEIMTQQQNTFSQKLQEERLAREKEIKIIMEEERKKIENELKERISEEKEKLSVEMNHQLQEELGKEIKRLEEIHVSTLREAMSDQQSKFEDALHSTLQIEREKFADTLKTAVKEAQKSTERSISERRKFEEKKARNHTMALKMLLSSALEQVNRNLTDDPSDEDFQESAVS